MTARVSVLGPLEDGRWDDLLVRHPRASVFHTRGWLEALRRTYDYEPLVLTTTGEGPLQDGLLFCRVRGFLSRRLVSLPFSDHCDPLVDRPETLAEMIDYLRGEVEGGRYRSFELRPRVSSVGQGFGLAGSCRYCLHGLDLSRPTSRIFAAFHHSSTQRAIRRAERESLTYEAGGSERLLAGFYNLLRLTRRRHGLPPQPLSWFRNLLECLRGAATIHVASKDGQPIASILTLSYKNTLIYKYGGSDAGKHRLGGMPFLFWRAIQDGKARGADYLDLGRSDVGQAGLIAFKDHLGATRSPLTYYTWPGRPRSAAHDGLMARAAKLVAAHLPDAALDLTGRLLYKHLG